MTHSIKSRKIAAFIVSLVLIGIPFFVSAAGLVPDCNKGPLITEGQNAGQFADPCDFNDAMTLVNKVINFLLFVIATPFVALCIAWAGWLMISSGGSSEKVTKAKHIATNLVIGYVIALAAWLIVKTILTSLGVNMSEPDEANYINTFLK
jgi:hypothetical protein